MHKTSNFIHCIVVYSGKITRLVCKLDIVCAPAPNVYKCLQHNVLHSNTTTIY